MKQRMPNKRSRAGFTLVEALVACVIVVIGIAGALAAISTGVRAQAAASFYQTAAVLVEQKMGELEGRSDLSEGETKGEFDAPHDGYEWTCNIQATPDNDPEGLWDVKLVVAKTGQSEGGRQAKIETYLLRREQSE